MMSSDRARPEILFYFFATAFLMCFENIFVFFFANLNLISDGGVISNRRRMEIEYALILCLILPAIYKHYFQRGFRYSMRIPILYSTLLLYSAFRFQNANMNLVGGSFYRSWYGIACMLSLEYIVARNTRNTVRRALDSVVLLIMIFGSVFIYLELYQSKIVYEQFGAVNNIYFLLPFVAYWSTKKSLLVANAAMLLGVILAMVSLKRGAVIASLSMAYLNLLFRSKATGRVRAVATAALSLVVIACSYFVVDVGISGGFLAQRIAEIADGSGRMHQYRWAVTSIAHMSVRELLLGRGMNSSAMDYGMFIHNDWLLLQYELGIIGLLPFLLIWFSLAKYCRHLWMRKSPYLVAWILYVCYWFCLSLYSNGSWVYSENILPMLGIVLGMERRRMIDMRRLSRRESCAVGSSGGHRI